MAFSDYKLSKYGKFFKGSQAAGINYNMNLGQNHTDQNNLTKNDPTPSQQFPVIIDPNNPTGPTGSGGSTGAQTGAQTGPPPPATGTPPASTGPATPSDW